MRDKLRNLLPPGDVSPHACQWHLIAAVPRPCENHRNHTSGVKLCDEHIRRIGYMSGMVTPRNVERYADNLAGLRTAELHVEIDRLQAIVEWQATRLREATAKPTRETPTVGTIYAIRNSDQVKIGWTGRPVRERLRDYPPSYEVLTHFPGTLDDEMHLKRRFAHLRTHGTEWITYEPSVAAWVEQMVAQHGAPDPTITCGPAAHQPPRPHSTAKPRPRPKGTRWHVA